jgi:hypothetical protein
MSIDQDSTGNIISLVARHDNCGELYVQLQELTCTLDRLSDDFASLAKILYDYESRERESTTTP